jgi:ClpP class serine protease
MASWGELLTTVTLPTGGIDMQKLEELRRRRLKDLATSRNRNVLVYSSGWLQKNIPNPAISINDDDMNGFMNAVHGMDHSKGLDLILHTPGGDVAATESIIRYLSDCFNHDIVAFVPQLAMSGGTMLACMAREIVMGKQSSIGPTDPLINGIPAGGVVEEFNQAISEVQANPSSLPIWAQIVNKYTPTFLGECQKAVNVSQKIVQSALQEGMFANENSDKGRGKAENISKWLGAHSESGMHNRHISARQAKEHGLKIVDLEKDNELQDKVLTLHHI